MSNLKVASWNVHGLYANLKKLNDYDFLESIKTFDVVILLETWHVSNSTIDVPNFNHFDKPIKKSKKRDRNRGGIIVLHKPHLEQNITKIDSSLESSLWLKLHKSHLGSHQDLYLCCTYRRPLSNNEYCEEYFETLESETAQFSGQGICMITGDFNARTSTHEDYIGEDDQSNAYIPLQNYTPDIPTKRNSIDKNCNKEGKLLLSLCKSSQLKILNGRKIGDSLGYYTYYHTNGCSTVDYTLCQQNFMDEIRYFSISPPTHLSDHCMQHFMVKANINKTTKPTTISLDPNFGSFKWEDNHKQAYRDTISSPAIQAKISQLMSSTTDCSTLLKETESIMIEASMASAKFIPGRRKTNKRKTTGRKDWFDNDCAGKRKLLRSQQRAIQKDPNNPMIRGQFIKMSKDYRRTLKAKQREHKDALLRELSHFEASNPKMFWKAMDKLRENKKRETMNDNIRNIPADHWYDHFKSLSLKQFEDTSIEEELSGLELRSREGDYTPLDYRFSMREIKTAIRKLQNNKASGSDLICNEMLKLGITYLTPLIQKLFNEILDTAQFPTGWNKSFLVPMYKSGDKGDCGNYRGIRICSCSGKLFTSILQK